MSEVANIPQLRFPEFGDNWEEKKLGNVTSIVMGQSPDSTSYNSNGIGLYLIQGNADIKKRKTLPRVWTDTPTKECKVGDIIMTVRAPVGAVAKSIHNACIGRGVCAIRNNQHSVSNYIYQFLLSFEKKWVKFEQGSTFTAVNTKDVKSLKLILPPVQEQQKIAAFLTAVDSKIEQLSKKKALLGEYKKGLMQQIFSQEIRFKADDGSDFPDWEEKKLGNISNVSKLAGYEFTKYIKYQDTGSIIALRGLNIKKNKLDLSVVKFIDNSDFSRLNRSKLFIDDLMFTYIGTIGEVALIDEDDKYYLAPNVSRIRFNNEVCLPRFAIQYFNREVFKQGEIKKYVSSSSQPALTMGNVRLFILNLPTKPEQQKIANFLSSIDSKIEQVGEQLDKSKQFKKALLQQIFV